MFSLNYPFDDFGYFYPPRRLVAGNQKDSGLSGSQDQNAVSTRNYPRSLFFDNDPINWNGDFDNFKVVEEPDKYLVTYREPNFKNKDFNLHFLKKENTLVVKTSEKRCDKCGGNGETDYSSHSEARVKLEKPVKFEGITADKGENSILLTVPKVEPDDEKNVHKIELRDSDS